MPGGSTEIHRSMSSGEVAPALYSRADTARYQNGLRTCRNFEVMRHGGAQNRPGTKFVCEVKDSTKAVRLVEFVFSEDQTYVLEFGDLYMRVIKNGALLTEATKNIAAITQANPGQLTINAHGYSNGQELEVKNVEGMTALNGRNFKVANVTANTFTLRYPDGTDVDTSLMPAYTTVLTTGTVGRVYEIVSPYAVADLPAVKYAQSADIINMAHPSYPPYELARTGDISWTLTASSFLPALPRPVAFAGVVGGVGAVPYKYKVTGIAVLDGSESLPGKQVARAITGATQANPVVITANGHGYTSGDEVLLENLGGMTQLNNGVFIVTVIGVNTFSLNGVDGTAYSAYTAGGNAFRTMVSLLSVDPTLVAPNVLTWTTSPLVQEYNVYRSVNGQFGFLGVSTDGTFNDIGAPVNATKTPPIYRNPFASAGNYPAAVAYHQQRLAFANTNKAKQTIYESRTGQFHDFSISSPLQDDDALTYTLAGQRVSEIRHLMFMGKLLPFTSGSEFAIKGDSSGIVSPFAINAEQQSGHGSSHLRPINVDGTALFVQARGSKVRDFNFNFQSDNYQGNDLSVYSAHLFDGLTLVDWAYQQEPNSLVWAVRSDGTLIGLTYVREQQIFAWHRHDTDGSFQNVASVPESLTDAVYVVVSRRVITNGVPRTARYIERLAERLVADDRDYIFMDSALSFDGRQTNTNPLTLTGSGWTSVDTLTLTSVGAIQFKASDVGNAVYLTASDGTVIRFTITGYTNVNVVTGQAHKNVPVSLQGAATTVWNYAVKTFGGLWHLEGKYVSVYADAFVDASPGNESYNRIQVVNGQITLPKPRVVVHVGLFYESDIETLDLENVNGETLVDKAKLVGKVTLFVQSSRGGWAGDKPPDNDPSITDVANNTNYVAGLDELKLRDDESMDDPVRMVTEAVDTVIAPKWNKNGRVFVRQIDPLPISVLAIAPTGLLRA